MSPTSSSRQSGALQIYRVATLAAVGGLGALECRVAEWNMYVFWTSMATVVVSVAALAAYFTRRPTTGPVWLELAASVIFGAHWAYGVTLHVHKEAGRIGWTATGCLVLYALVLDLATIPIMWRKENPWTRPVHAMNHAAIVLPEDQNAAQNDVSTQALAAEAASQTGTLNTYRLVTLFAVVVLAATECRMSPWDFFMFWVPMSTEVVSVAALAAYITRRPTSGPVWLELTVSTVLSGLWVASSILRTLRHPGRSPVTLTGSAFLVLYSLVLAIAAIRSAWRKESPWTRAVHAMGNGHIMLVDEQGSASDPFNV